MGVGGLNGHSAENAKRGNKTVSQESNYKNCLGESSHILFQYVAIFIHAISVRSCTVKHDTHV